MARSKLTARDREQLVKLYRDTEATLQGLADQFSVSYSTASRIVKEGIPTAEYQALVKSKRAGGDRKSAKPAPPASAAEATQTSLLETISPAETDDSEKKDGGEVSQDAESLSLADSAEADPPESHADDGWEDGADEGDADVSAASPSDDAETDDFDAGDREADDFDDFDDDFDAEPSEEEASIAAELMNDDDADEDEDDIEATLDEDDEDEDEGDDESDDEDEGDDEPDDEPQAVDISVRDLDDLELPQRIYAVVDRFQELSAAPLADFKHLGSIPDELAAANTLPLFDEHRVARRFADRSKRYGRNKNRPIAFPGHYVQVTRTQLRAKGIEYLLYDGQVYAL